MLHTVISVLEGVVLHACITQYHFVLNNGHGLMDHKSHVCLCGAAD